jgi:tetratricopeptide (TPR) repeat protein
MNREVAMTSFAKAFISHSSADKGLIGEIASRVTAARWEIDSYTFEEGKRSAAEVLAALRRSDLFVLIASANSMNSEWVKSELEIAQQLLYSGGLGGVVVFIIDGTPAEKLPDWIRMHVFVRTASAVRIANIVRSKLFELDARKGIKPKPFVQRMKIRGDIERRIADLSSPPRALYLSGVDGIGRRSLIADTFRSLFPGLDVVGVQISVSDSEGLLEVYRKLYFELKQPTVAEAKAFFDEMAAYTRQQFVEKTVDLLKTIGDQKMVAWLKFDYDILDDDGNFHPDFHELFDKLKSLRPTVVFCAKRMPRFREQKDLSNVGFFKIGSLTDEESKLLWIYALEYLGFENADAAFISALRGHVSGHPAMIWTAAEYVAAAKRPAIEANPRDLLETLRGLSFSLVDGLQISDFARRLLALFDEFGAIDPADLLEICDESDQLVTQSVNRLLSLGLLESEGDHLRLASYFRNARFRKQFSAEADQFLSEARKKLLGLTLTYKAEDNISFSTVDVAITNAISQGKPLPLDVGERAVVGSHYLRVARGCYDRENYKDTVVFASEALAKRYTLTEDAVVECLRLLGMAAIRIGNEEKVDSAVHALAEIKTNQASRHVHFIRGFHARWNGEFDKAEAEFLETLRISEKDTHALREIAQLLTGREDYAAAERYARDALARAPGNPFVIDILLRCLIEKHKGQNLANDEEIEELFAQLEVAERRELTEFGNLRSAEYYAALGDFPEAIRYADAAVREYSGKVTAFALRAEIKLGMKADPAILQSVESDIKQIQKIADESQGTRTHGTLLAKLRVRFELAKGNLSAAIRALDGVPRGNHKLRRKLSLEIAHEAVSRGEKDSRVVEFANRILSED